MSDPVSLSSVPAGGQALSAAGTGDDEVGPFPLLARLPTVAAASSSSSAAASSSEATTLLLTKRHEGDREERRRSSGLEMSSSGELSPLVGGGRRLVGTAEAPSTAAATTRPRRRAAVRCRCASERAGCESDVCCLDFLGEGAPEGDQTAPAEATKRCARLACGLLRAQSEQMMSRQSLLHTHNPRAEFAPYRSLVVQWILDVGLGLELSPLAVHSSVALLDRALTRSPVPRKRLQLVALCCVLLASKAEEDYERVPSIGQLNHCANSVFTEREVVDMERRVLDTVGWRVLEVTAAHFAGVLEETGWVCACDRVRAPATGPGASYYACTGRVHRYVGKYVQFFLDFAAREHGLQRFRPSVLAAAVLAASRTVCGLRPVWNGRLARAARHVASEIEPCWRELLGLYRAEYPEESAHHLSADDVARLPLERGEEDDADAVGGAQEDAAAGDDDDDDDEEAEEAEEEEEEEELVEEDVAADAEGDTSP